MKEVQSYVGLWPNVIEGAAFCHDATWTLAKALNNTMNGVIYFVMSCIAYTMYIHVYDVTCCHTCMYINEVMCSRQCTCSVYSTTR